MRGRIGHQTPPESNDGGASITLIISESESFYHPKEHAGGGCFCEVNRETTMRSVNGSLEEAFAMDNVPLKRSLLLLRVLKFCANAWV